MTHGYGPSAQPKAFSDKVLSNQEAEDCLIPMGITSENVAKEYGISRSTQDAFAANSFQKAAAAQEKWARVPLQQRIAIGRAFMVRGLRGLKYASVIDKSPPHRKSLGRCAMISRWN